MYQTQTLKFQSFFHDIHTYTMSRQSIILLLRRWPASPSRRCCRCPSPCCCWRRRWPTPGGGAKTGPTWRRQRRIMTRGPTGKDVSSVKSLPPSSILPYKIFYSFIHIVFNILIREFASISSIDSLGLFSLFNIVTFSNDQCVTQSDTAMRGTCLTSEDCNSKGGTADGNCAAGNLLGIIKND